jgi:hypothetical protein
MKAADFAAEMAPVIVGIFCVDRNNHLRVDGFREVFQVRKNGVAARVQLLELNVMPV